MKKINAFIFDLDQTLIDSATDIAFAANMLLANHNLPQHTVETYRKLIGNGARTLIKKALPEAEANQKNIEDLYKEFLIYYDQAQTKNTALYPGISALLSTLQTKKIPISILTNKPHDIAVKVCDLLLADWKFEIIRGYVDGYPGKPDAYGALLIADKMKVPINEIAFVGDLIVDIKTAKNAGMISIGACWDAISIPDLVSAGADFLVDEPKEILYLLTTESTEVD